MERVAVEFSLDAFDHGVREVKGRHMASRSFLGAYLKYGRAARVDALAADPPTAMRFLELARSSGVGREYGVVPSERFEALEGSVLVSGGPAIGISAWERRRFGVGMSLVGVTHSLCSTAAMEALGGLLTAPVEGWDALVCTSPTAREVVVGVLDRYGEYLVERFGSGAVFPPRPQLPVIPFGVDCEGMAALVSERGRGEWRVRLGIEEGDAVVLHVGRLSLHAKAHPLPLFTACERASRALGRRIVLILAGQFPNESVRDAYQQLARVVAPAVRVIFMDGTREEVPRDLWQVADVFCSLVDNVQETFGLAVVEAMAAGLPCVVSDWDGYRSLVRDGVDGLLVETTTLASDGGANIASRYAQRADDYNRMVGHVSQSVAVSQEGAASALIRLFSDETLRREMGRSASERARAAFDWRVVIGVYDALFEDLTARRRADAKGRFRGGVPLAGDPFEVFRGYPTRVLLDEDTVEATGVWTIADVEAFRALPANSFSMAVNPVAVAQVWGVLSEAGRCPLRMIRERVSRDVRPLAGPAVMWLMKAGFVRRRSGRD
jgi:glycosyltransferase involved in cell wall biosynthesis